MSTSAMSASSPCVRPASMHAAHALAPMKARYGAACHAASGIACLRVGERVREHDFREHGTVAHEVAVEHDELDQIPARVIGLDRALQVTVQQPEALEEHLADQATLVAEQLIDRRRRGVGLLGDTPRRGETRHSSRSPAARPRPTARDHAAVACAACGRGKSEPNAPDVPAERPSSVRRKLSEHRFGTWSGIRVNAHPTAGNTIPRW